jgi:hypothetical protein
MRAGLRTNNNASASKVAFDIFRSMLNNALSFTSFEENDKIRSSDQVGTNLTVHILAVPKDIFHFNFNSVFPGISTYIMGWLKLYYFFTNTSTRKYIRRSVVLLNIELNLTHS